MSLLASRPTSSDLYPPIWPERAAAIASLDEEHRPLEQPPSDQNIYALGRIGPHNVAIASLPAGETGTASAAAVATQMLRTFPSIRIGLMVGVGGGAPNKEYDIRLGDVVVSRPTKTSGGVVQYDFGRTIETGRFVQTGSLSAPPRVLLTAVGTLQANHMLSEPELGGHMVKLSSTSPKWAKSAAYPGVEHDMLFDAKYDHVGNHDSEDCSKCDKTRLIYRGFRDSICPVIHYGAIASANQVMRHGTTRDGIAKEHGVICFDMEAAGLMENFPCLVVRGICDYADTHKNKGWQPYAAAAAAAYAKELLLVIPGSGITNTRTASAAIRITELLQRLQYEEMSSRKAQIYDAPDDSFEWIWSEKGTDTSFGDWLSNEKPLFWIRGKAGSGKSTLMKYVARHETTRWLLLQSATARRVQNVPWVVLDFFFDFRAGKELANNFEGLLRCLLLDLVKKIPKAAKDLDILQELDQQGQSLHRIPLHRLQSSLKQALASCNSNVCIFLDGLDEYDGRYLDLIDFAFSIASETHSLANRTKVCLASRPEPLILESFDKLPGFVVEEYNSASIHKYVCNRFQSRVGESADPGLRKVRTMISELALGVFLWARLVTDETVERYAEGAATSELLAALEDIPSGLEAMYARMLSRVKLQYRYEASVMLQLVSHAAEPIQLQTLFAAVHIVMDAGSIEPDDSGVRNFDKRVRAFTGGLVETVPRKGKPNLEVLPETSPPINRVMFEDVRLIHETVRKYLGRAQALQNFVQAPGQETCHRDELWMRICASTLAIFFQNDDLENWAASAISLSSINGRDFNPPLAKIRSALESLEKYARKFLLHHALRFEQTAHRSSFAVVDGILSVRLWQRHVQLNYGRQSSALPHFRRPAQGAIIVPLLLLNQMDGERPNTVLSIAVKEGLLLYCEDKIRSGADVNEHNGIALRVAIAHHSEAAVQVLLRAGARCNESHMMHALAGFSPETIKHMLDQLDDIRSPNWMLHVAAGTMLPWNSRIESIVSLLLEWGCNLNQPVEPVGTPLHACLRAGFTGTRDNTLRRRIKFMLELGADINAKDHEGNTPLDAGFHVFKYEDILFAKPYADDFRFLLDMGAKRSGDRTHELELWLRQF